MFKDITETESYIVNPIIDKETLEHIFKMETSSICHSIRFYHYYQGKYISSEIDSYSKNWSEEFSLGGPKEMVKRRRGRDRHHHQCLRDLHAAAERGRRRLAVCTVQRG